MFADVKQECDLCVYKYDFPCYFHTQENRMRGLGCSQEPFLSHHPPPSLLSSALIFVFIFSGAPSLFSPSITGLSFSLLLLSSSPSWPSAHCTLYCLCLPAAPSFPPPALATCPHLDSGSLQGGTDLEKHRDLLMVENERLRQEMRRCEAELQELRAKPAAPCTGCEHSQVGPGPVWSGDRGLDSQQSPQLLMLTLACWSHT